MIKCENDGCDIEFTAMTHNQKYHSAECCRVATNRRIMQKYYAKRDQRAGKARYCRKCGVTKLSRYNDGEICGACNASSIAEANSAVALMLAAVSWQA